MLYFCCWNPECEDSFYGLNCDLKCNCQSSSEVCDKITGSCLSGCKSGFAGNGCQIGVWTMLLSHFVVLCSY